MLEKKEEKKREGKGDLIGYNLNITDEFTDEYLLQLYFIGNFIYNIYTFFPSEIMKE